MGTRSRIGTKKDDLYLSIYCHWDGYPDNNGKILKNNYTNHDIVCKLLSFGDLSSLSKTIEECDFFVKKYRNEDPIVPRYYRSFDDLIANAFNAWEEYFYFFDPETNSWTCFDSRKNKIDLSGY